MAAVDDVKAVLQLGFDVAKAVKTAKETGVLNLQSDLALILPLIPEVTSVAGVLANVPKDLTQLTDADLAPLLALGEAAFPGLAGDAALATKLQKAYQVGLSIAELISVL